MNRFRYCPGLMVAVLLQCCLPVLLTPQTKIATKPQWKLFPSPVKSTLQQIKMLSPSLGYMGGNVILHYNGTQWQILKNQPQYDTPTYLHVADTKTIWVSTHEQTSESFLFRFNGQTWSRVQHPMANVIYSINLDKYGKGWLGGWNELVHSDGVHWKHYPSPPFDGVIVSVTGNERDRIWVYHENTGLYCYHKGTWTRLLNDRSVHAVCFDYSKRLYALTDDELFELIKGEWRLHSRDSLLSGVRSLAVTTQGSIWGIGRSGLVVTYDGHSWKNVYVPTQEHLNSIALVSETEGWIAGDNGVILHYSDQPQQQENGLVAGFDKMKLIDWGKDVNDEYGVGIDDLNGDGLKDIYTVKLYTPNELYLNRGQSLLNKTLANEARVLFEETASTRLVTGLKIIPEKELLPQLDLGMGMSDVDNDGDLDLYLCNLMGANLLLVNDGQGYFRDVSAQQGRAQGKGGRSNSVCFGDVDNDGDLDMFVTNEQGSNLMYLNNGNGYYSDVTESAGLSSLRRGMCASFADIDNDGDLDLCVTFWSARNKLYRNISTPESGVRFVECTENPGIGGEEYQRSNGLAFADIDNDGDLDLFIAKRRLPNRLYLNDGTGKFTDVTVRFLGLDSLATYGVSFGDVDHDGFVDLYISCVGECRLYKNDHGARFIDVTQLYGARHPGYNTGLAMGDIDNDGDLDIYSATYINSTSILLRNSINNLNFIALTVKGTISNRDAVGVKAWLYENGHAGEKEYLLGMREITSGSGYGSHNSLEVHFGAEANRHYDILIEFPASKTKRILHSIAAGQRLVLQEEEGAAAWVTNTGKLVQRIFIEPEIHREAVKFSIALALCLMFLHWSRKRYQWNHRTEFLLYGGVLLFYSIQVSMFYLESLFTSTILPLGTVLVLLVVSHLVYERIILKRSAEHERRATRDRIARDLHDDLASTLSSASIYLNGLNRSFRRKSASQKEIFSKVEEALSSASESITDIVWTVSTKHDTLADLIARIRLMAVESSSLNSIECAVQVQCDDDQLVLPELVRRNIFLIFKESLNNCIKHAGATTLQFSITLQKETLQFILRDNGKGFHRTAGMSHPRHGHGLENIESRAEEIGARAEIFSLVGQGTTIHLTYRMKQLHH